MNKLKTSNKIAEELKEQWSICELIYNTGK